MGGPDSFFPMVKSVRRLEGWLRSVRGFQHTYCDSFQSEEEFEQVCRRRRHLRPSDQFLYWSGWQSV